jgi:CubicO group peptidase (beta-lactamase class C family)
MSKQATIRDCCGNRLGLSRHGFNEYGANVDVPAEETFRRLQYQEIAAPFRDKFTYVNPGHTAVGVAIGRISGTRFLDFLKTRLFTPLGMTHSSGGAAAKVDLAENYASWHTESAGKTIRVDAIFSDNYLGGGGLCISGEDAARWLKFNLNSGAIGGHQVISPECLQEIFSPQAIVRPEDLAIWIGVPDSAFAAYGLGWAISELEGHKVVRHSGSDAGVGAQVALVHEAGIAVSVYINKNCAPAALESNYTILAALLGIEQRDWRSLVTDEAAPSTHYEVPRIMTEPDTTIASALDLSDYEGDYQSPGNGVATVRRNGERLSLKFHYASIYNCDLYPLGGNSFLPIARYPAQEKVLRVETKFVVNGKVPKRLVVPEVGEFTR